nr:T9SS type A sorting domain-containing protein [uncultured Flavobacterium sp.]
MKKILYLAIILNGYLSFGQINIEHTYTTTTNISNEGYGFVYAFNTHQGIFYYTKEYLAGSNMITIYDSNHNFYKSINTPFGSEICLITDKLFNSDGLIEFLYVVGIHTYLMNENGELLFTWSDRWDPKLYRDNDNNYKLVVYNRSSSSSSIVRTSDVYSLGGTLSLEQQELYLDKSFKGYPNPTSNKIKISNGKYLVEETVLEIFDGNGKKVTEKKIMSGEKEIILDVSSYSNGIYIFKINGEAHKFVKN